jgi:hypothetical protein
VSPGLCAAAFCDRCDAGVLLEGISRALAFSLCAAGDEEAGGKDGPGAWPGVKPGAVRMALGVLRASFKVGQGAHRGTLGGKRGELVAICEEECDLEFGIGGIILGPARGKRFSGLRQGARPDGKEHEAIRLAQCGHNEPFIACKAHGDGDKPALCRALCAYQTPSGSPSPTRTHERYAMCRRARGRAGGGCGPGAD